LVHRVRRYLGCAVVVAAACNSIALNEEGDLFAERTGSIVALLAPRSAPDAELVARCGDGAATELGSTSLLRSPFLQQVTSQGGLVVFRTNARRPIDIDVTTSDGARVATFVSADDPSVTDGAQQVSRLEGLKPSTTYCYSLRGLTGPVGFRTAPRPGTGARVRFAVFGDSGTGGSDQQALLQQLHTVPFDFIVHTGDLAYNSGTAAQLDRGVFRVYAPLLRSFAMFPIAGNHEYQTDAAAPFLQAFVLPENGASDALERWYSFDWGDVHFVGLDTEQIGKTQAAWLEADLLKNRLPWTVVFGHRPPFSSGEHGSDDEFREHFVPVLERYQVPLVLSGHEHNYERTKVLDGVTYVVTGGGGRGTRPVGHSSFTAFSEAVVHFVFVQIQAAQLVLHAIDGTGREFDQVSIALGGRLKSVRSSFEKLRAD
jgi:acid phosphatase type 7